MVKHKDLLFSDFSHVGPITKEQKEKNESRIFVGGVRINSGKYRTDEEDKAYRENAIKKELP